MKRYRLPLLLLAFVLLVILVVAVRPGMANLLAPPPAPTEPPDAAPAIAAQEQAVENAVLQAVNEQQEDLLVALIFETQVDHITISEDGQWATAWMSPIDPETGAPVPLEPGLAVLQKVNGNWEVVLPNQPNWVEALQQASGEAITPERAEDLMLDMAEITRPSAPLGGYLLPWEGGVKLYMTQSVGHDRYTPSGSAHFAFDFATSYPSARFPLYAAKSGVVVRTKDTCEKEQVQNCPNYVVLEDTTTTPTTYQLYLHLAPHSIPAEVRELGSYVQQGQYIGIANNTGVSTANHLHFQVQANLAGYWGTSVDITFDDVTINGGRPRTYKNDRSSCKPTDVCNEWSDTYISGNYPQGLDRTRPTGGITAPADGGILDGAIITLSGWGQDENSGLAGAEFVALYNGAWRTVGTSLTFPEHSTNRVTFNTTWDLCADGVPDGPVSLALRVTDAARNSSDLLTQRNFTRNGTCPRPAPACKPNDNQVALFSRSDFQGDCVLLGTGDFTTPATLGAVGGDNAESVQVGKNVQVILFDEVLAGRSQTFISQDRNLADNRIGANHVTSARVQLRTTTPAKPVLVWPVGLSQAIPDPDGSGVSISLVAHDGGGAQEYELELNGATVPWQAEPVWSLGSLPQGAYIWRVRARNALGTVGSWTALSMFDVQNASPALPVPSTTPLSLPLTDTMDLTETLWINSNNWDRTGSVNHGNEGRYSWGYDTGQEDSYISCKPGSNPCAPIPSAGDLTSAPIAVPAEGDYYLRFYYLYETESNSPLWDQRWVQISVDGGPFLNVLQLQDDPTGYWLQSPAIPLNVFRGHTVRIRFHFETMDAAYNDFLGWFIDDVTINTQPPAVCPDADGGLLSQALAITYDTPIPAVICPAGDVDYYRFEGQAGDKIGAYIRAKANGSQLDSTLTLLDADGRSLLSFNDDEQRQVVTDSAISYTLPASQTYYLKVRAWDHPAAGGESFTYTLTLVKDHQNPQLTFAFPKTGANISSGPIPVRLDASDLPSGVSHVEIWWHSGDWKNGQWVRVGEDWNGADGWGLDVIPTENTNLNGMALYAFAYDWAGNRIGASVWNLTTNAPLFLPIIQANH